MLHKHDISIIRIILGGLFINLEEELKRTISEYLCTECKGLLYFELKCKDDICINPKCVLFPPFLKFRDVTHADALKTEMRERKASLRLRIIRTKRNRFIRYLHSQRKEVIENLLVKGKAKFEKILVLDELLIFANVVNFSDRRHSSSHFAKILEDYLWFFGVENQVEDIVNLRNLLSVENKVFMLKYWTVIMNLYRGYGIISGKIDKLTDAFKHLKIDKEAKEKIEFQKDMDIGRLFEQQFDHITALKYLLERYFRTSNQHKYNPTGLEIAILMGLFFSVKKDTQIWSRKSLRDHYERTAAAGNIKGNFSDFVEKYATSRQFAPVIPFDGQSYLLDKMTLLFYIPYLVGKNRALSEGQDETGEKRIVKKKQQASIVFEQYIRENLKTHGFEGPNKPLIVAEHNEEYEFDVIGVKEKEKKILLVEAKYRDFSPSSLTGKTLIQQELFDKDNGLLVEAIRHMKRLEFFHKYSERFSRELLLKSSINDYQVSAWIVTKHTPLISKYRQVLIRNYDAFEQQFSSYARARRVGEEVEA